MSTLADIKPTTRQRVMDLVSDAGFDVSDWGNYKRGPALAAANPKYCYNWAFKSAERVLLSLWHAHMTETDGQIEHTFNIRDFSLDCKRKGLGTLGKRAYDMDLVLQHAHHKQLPMRVMICEGDIRDKDDDQADASRVKFRLLDSEPWSIQHYDKLTGACHLVRGAPPSPYVDQFSLPATQPANKILVTTSVRERKAEVREKALRLAQGKCQHCNKPGFTTHGGRIYLETHHVIPLSEDGPDDERNVVALCADDHRRAHHGAEREAMQKQLLALLADLYQSQPAA